MSDDIGCSVREAAIGRQRIELALEPFEDVHLVLALEIGRPDRAELQLQNELANHPLFCRRTIRPAEREVSRPTAAPAFLPAVDVLHVHTVDMAERGDAETNHVGALPQLVTVNEAGAGRIFTAV